MNHRATEIALAAMTDEGRFELLANAVLREAEPMYRSLTQTGVNVAGKTIKSPVDGVGFVQGAAPPHMIAVHHTTTASKQLRRKWLYDPEKKDGENDSGKPDTAGDIPKTLELVQSERRRTPELNATLVLTTNQNPDQKLVRDAIAAGYRHDLEVDVWSNSRLAHFLDNKPVGNWLRKTHLGIDAELLSAELLLELSQRSVKTWEPPDDASAWVHRSLDDDLKQVRSSTLTFVVAESGMGKTIACFRELKNHVDGGGFGLVLSHDVIASALSLEQAVTSALHQLHPSLSQVSQHALSYCSSERPLLLVVEDVIRFGDPASLVEKLVLWNRGSAKGDSGSPHNWRIVCPLRPDVLPTLGDQLQKSLGPLMLRAAGFSSEEGRSAIEARARSASRLVSSSTAENISNALGDDPLLIGLHSMDPDQEPRQVIQDFINAAANRVATSERETAATDYVDALRLLMTQMLLRREMNPTWRRIRDWVEMGDEPLRLLSQLGHRGEVLSFTGSTGEQQLAFRHDRVLDWLLADAVDALAGVGKLPDDLIAEPFFAEVMGAVITRRPIPGFINRVAELNPLALFQAFRLVGESDESLRASITDAIHGWLNESSTHDRSHAHLRWEAMVFLSQTDSSRVPAIANRFQNQREPGHLARLRNGDVTGGIELCCDIHPGIGAPWRDVQIEHALLHHKEQLIGGLNASLMGKGLSGRELVGALRLAGHFADPSLASAIEFCWNTDSNRTEHLAEYIWAFGMCCGEDAERYLEPVCDAWASLSDEPEEGHQSPRNSLATDELRWAFQKWLPANALGYLVQRGSNEDLRWPITYMLHGIDHPDAVTLVVREIARIVESLEGTKSFSPFAATAGDDWRRRQEDAKPMSVASRAPLLPIWRDQSNETSLRRAAFSFWAATTDSNDLDLLRSVDPSDKLGERILEERIRRRDAEAIPELIQQLDRDNTGRWWQLCRHIWSPDLTAAVANYMNTRKSKANRVWDESFAPDWIVSELIMGLPADEAERLLLKEWDHVRFSPLYVQAALYISTPDLQQAADEALKDCPDPAKMLEHLSFHFRLRTKSRAGLTRQSQIRGLAPYLHLMSPGEVHDLWEASNEHGWYSMRRELLDDLLEAQYLRNLWDVDRSYEQLDEMVEQNRTVLIDRWIDDYLKSGTSWRDIRNAMAAWLNSRHSIEALRVFASAIESHGSREDLTHLSNHALEEHAAGKLIADAEFVVKRRTLD